MYINEAILGCHSAWCGKPWASFGLELYNAVFTEGSGDNSSLCVVGIVKEQKTPYESDSTFENVILF
jgi:hypothetical protein